MLRQGAAHAPVCASCPARNLLRNSCIPGTCTLCYFRLHLHTKRTSTGGVHTALSGPAPSYAHWHPSIKRVCESSACAHTCAHLQVTALRATCIDAGGHSHHVHRAAPTSPLTRIHTCTRAYTWGRWSRPCANEGGASQPQPLTAQVWVVATQPSIIVQLPYYGKINTGPCMCRCSRSCASVGGWCRL